LTKTPPLFVEAVNNAQDDERAATDFESVFAAHKFPAF
jgi:hypothetical protein